MADNPTNQKRPRSSNTEERHPQQSPSQVPASGVVNKPPIPPRVVRVIAQQIPFGAPTQLVLPGIIQQAAHWQGPYPPPEAVERYEKVLPGTFNRLIAMAEQLQSSQIEQSKLALEFAQANSARGHWLGFAGMGLAIFGALVCVWFGEPWVAAAFVSVPVMAVAKALVDAAKASPKEIVAIGTPEAIPPDATQEPTG